MKKTFLGILGIGILCLPIVVIGVVYLLLRINIFNNPDFWYGYMAYFGTTFLAIVSLWQNENANETNRSLSEKNLYYQDVVAQKLLPIVCVKEVSASACVSVAVHELKNYCPPKACTFDCFTVCKDSNIRDEVLAINFDIDNIQDGNKSTYKKMIHLNICNCSEAVIRHILVEDIEIFGYKGMFNARHCQNMTQGNGLSCLLSPNASLPLTIDIFFANDSILKMYDHISGGVGMMLFLTNTTITGIKQKQCISINIRGEKNSKITYGDKTYSEVAREWTN